MLNQYCPKLNEAVDFQCTFPIQEVIDIHLAVQEMRPLTNRQARYTHSAFLLRTLFPDV
jgi:hypothetical protein